MVRALVRIDFNRIYDAKYPKGGSRVVVGGSLRTISGQRRMRLEDQALLGHLLLASTPFTPAEHLCIESTTVSAQVADAPEDGRGPLH
jgi:hypothetical protein